MKNHEKNDLRLVETNGKLSGGFTSLSNDKLAKLKGGTNTNSGTCSNGGACTTLNSGTCTNSGTCSGATNSGRCFGSK